MEELYVYIAPFALRRGYNFLTFDLPGQEILPTQGQYFRFDTELQISAILDEALRRFPEINPDEIVAYGISNGGYFVPRAATVEKRIRALAVSNAVTDNHKMFREMPFGKDTREEIQQWEPFRHDVIAAVAYRWNTDIKGLPIRSVIDHLPLSAPGFLRRIKWRNRTAIIRIHEADSIQPPP